MALLTDLIERAVNRLLMLGLPSLTAPKAALKFMKKAMRRYGAPTEIVMDKLRS